MATATHTLPGRQSRWMVDIALEMRRKGMLGFFEDAWRSYGDLARIQVGPSTMITIIHPDHVQHVAVTHRDQYDKRASYDSVRTLLLGDGLVTSTGALWRRQRRLMAPFFTPRGIEQYYDVIAQETMRFQARWERLAQQGEPVEVLGEMIALTATIILKALFSTESGAEISEIKDAVETMISFVSTRQMQPFHLPTRIRVGQNRVYWQAREHVKHYIDRVIAQRRALPDGTWPNDLLSKLMRARDEETGAVMSDQLLYDETLTLFFAGHETTARTLAFFWYALGQNPEAAAQIHAEIDAVVSDVPPTIAQLKQLAVTLHGIKETLRLYPSAPMYVRDCIANDEIGGAQVTPGTRMLMLPYLSHRHPAFWDAPERFDLDRWQPAVEAARHPFAFHPFAAGQRVCIGNNFSLFETHLIVAMLARRFAPRPLPGHTPQFAMAGTLTSTNGLPMTIVPR